MLGSCAEARVKGYGVRSEFRVRGKIPGQGSGIMWGP